jgi:hypothetical protein
MEGLPGPENMREVADPKHLEKAVAVTAVEVGNLRDRINGAMAYVTSVGLLRLVAIADND